MLRLPENVATAAWYTPPPVTDAPCQIGSALGAARHARVGRARPRAVARARSGDRRGRVAPLAGTQGVSVPRPSSAPPTHDWQGGVPPSGLSPLPPSPRTAARLCAVPHPPRPRAVVADAIHFQGGGWGRVASRQPTHPEVVDRASRREETARRSRRLLGRPQSHGFWLGVPPCRHLRVPSATYLNSALRPRGRRCHLHSPPLS